MRRRERRVSIGLSQSIKSISYVMPHVHERASQATLEAIKHNNNKMLQQLRVAKQKGGKSKSDIRASRKQSRNFSK